MKCVLQVELRNGRLLKRLFQTIKANTDKVVAEAMSNIDAELEDLLGSRELAAA
jgi:hypothetical protein